MSTNTSPASSGPLPRRILGSWYLPAILGAILLIGFAVWVMPVASERIIKDSAGNAHTVTVWDTSRWQAVSAFWWQASLIVGALLTVFCLTWSGHGWIAAKASTARFFAASLLCHCLLVLSVGTVPLARAVVEHAETIRVSQAAQFLDDPQQVQQSSRPAYEKLADLRTDAVKPQLVRQEPAPTPIPDGAPLVPTVPAHAVRSLPPERLMFVPRSIVRRPLEIPRSSAGDLKPIDLDIATPELPPPEALPREKPIEARPVIQGRQEAAVPIAGDPLHLRLPEMKQPHPADIPRQGEQPSTKSISPLEKLPGRRQPEKIALAVPSEPNAQLKPESAPADGPPGAGRVTLPRLAPVPSARILDDPTRPALPSRQPAQAAIPGPKPLAMPAFSPPGERLPRATARMDRAVPLEEKVAVQAPLPLRKKEERQRSVVLYGGSKASEAAVESGLDWLAAHQNPNGSWALHNFHVNCKHPKCADAGTVISDPAGTGIALLPFLGAGNTDQAGKHRLTVARALHWLVTQQQADGTWPAREDARPMYGHAMAAIALCEAYGMTKNPKLQGPARKALDYIIKAQHAGSGGWRYKPNQPGDTSVVGWQMMALKSGEMAGLSVPVKTFEGIKRWLISVEANRPVGGMFGYQSATPTPAMTAQGLLCLQYLGARRDDPRMRAGTDYLLKNLPRAGAETSYYWYHANQVMYHVQGKHWKAWNVQLRDLLVSTQEKKGALAGSWKPTDAREKPGGRVYTTALRVLMLEVYYRHLPLYQQLEK